MNKQLEQELRIWFQQSNDFGTRGFDKDTEEYQDLENLFIVEIDNLLNKEKLK